LQTQLKFHFLSVVACDAVMQVSILQHTFPSTKISFCSFSLLFLVDSWSLQSGWWGIRKIKGKSYTSILV